MAAQAQQPIDSTKKSQSDKSTAEVVGELWQLLKDYGKQETIDPIKSLGRFLAFGAPGSILLALGVTLLSLGALRGLQTQTRPHLTGSYTWVPYAITFVVAIVLVLAAVKAIGRTSKGKGGNGKDAKDKDARKTT